MHPIFTNFTNDEDLIPAAEYLLRAAQTSPDLLAEALAHEQYAFVLRLAQIGLAQTAPFGIPGSTQEAEMVAQEALAAAIADAYRYPSALGVQPWLAKYLWRACARAQRAVRRSPQINASQTGFGPAWEALGVSERLLAGLALAYDWPEDRLAAVFEQPPDRVAARLKAVLAALQAAAPGQTPHAWLTQHWPETRLSEPDQEVRAQAIQRRFARRQRAQKYRTLSLETLVMIGLIGLAAVSFWGINQILPPDPTPTPIVLAQPLTILPTPQWLENVSYAALPGDTVASVAARAGVSTASIYAVNELLPGQALYTGQPLWVPVPDFVARPTRPPRPLTPSLHLPALTPTSPASEVVQRIRDSRQTWRTLWIDLQISTYPTQVFNESLLSYRMQGWINQAGKSLELFDSRTSDAPTRFISLRQPGGDLIVHYYDTRLSVDWPDTPLGLLHNSLLAEMVFPGESPLLSPPRPTAIRAGGEIAGRPSLDIDLPAAAGRPRLRLWLDAQTGVILRHQQLDPHTGALLAEAAVQSIRYDAYFPSRLFDPRLPWQGGFAPGPRGGYESRGP